MSGELRFKTDYECFGTLLCKVGNYPTTLENLDILKTSGVFDKVPQDPSGSSYGYGACGSSGYAVQAKLEETNKKILDESATAGSCGLSCKTADKEYCIKF